DAHGALRAPLIRSWMRSALQITDAPLAGIKRLGSQATRIIQRYSRVIAKCRTCTSLHSVLPIAHDPFSGEIGRLSQHLFNTGSRAGLQTPFDGSSLLGERRNTHERDERQKKRKYPAPMRVDHLSLRGTNYQFVAVPR